MARPPVDILIPFHGKYELVTRCVGSIINCTPNQKFQIYLIDDCSPNADFATNLALVNKTITTVRLNKHSGFGAALYEGFQASQNNHVVFMHSDCCADNIYWLANLQRALTRLKDHGVKLVSSRTNNAGTSSSYDPRLVGERTEELPDIIVDSPLPLFCAYMNRELFSRIGGFIRPYEYGWFEDEELFYRMKYYGYKQAIVPSSYVLHAGGATINELCANSNRIKQRMEANRELCLEDIRPYLKK